VVGELGGRLVRRRAGPQASYRVELHVMWIGAQRPGHWIFGAPEVGPSRKVEPLRHDADDRARFAGFVYHQSSSDDVRIAAEESLPPAVTQYHHRRSTDDVVFGAHRAAEQRSRTEEIKKAA